MPIEQKKRAAAYAEKGQGMARMRTGRWALALCSVVVITACSDGNGFNFLRGSGEAEADGAETTRAASSTVTLVERDIEAPDVFQVNEPGLWDGRPSLGGVWVAHPDVTEPERVIIRNEENGKFVIGALFKRERDNPGPRLQVSSDAAAAIDLLAGAPAPLNVTALRRQEVPIAEEAPTDPVISAPEAIETETLDDPIAVASAALDTVDADGATVVQAQTPALDIEPTPTVAEAPRQTSSSLAKPFIQIGLFSVEDNAVRNGTALRSAGILPSIQEQESRGKTCWRVTVGPAPNALERAALLRKVKDLGYSDAYFVTN